MRKNLILILFSTLLTNTAQATDPAPVPSSLQDYCKEAISIGLQPQSFNGLKPSTQTILGDARGAERLIISRNGSFPTNTLLEQRFLSNIGKDGLKAAVQTEAYSSILLKHLLRLGFIKEEADDEYYVPFTFASENKAVRLDIKHEDKVVNRYITIKRLNRKAQLKGEVPVLNPITDGHRRNFLYWTTLKALGSIIEDEDKRSRDALHAAFIEIERLHARNALTPQLLDTVLSALRGSAGFMRKKLEVWAPLESILYELPFGSIVVPTLEVSLDLYDRLVDRNRMLRSNIYEVGHQPKGTEMVPGTLQVEFYSRDLFNYQEQAKHFYDKYILDRAPLEGADFVKDLEAAYPEIKIVMTNNKRFTTLNGVTGGYIDNGPYGPGNFDTYKVLGRTAITLALLRGDKDYFPQITAQEFADLQSDFFKTLKMTELNFSNVDIFLTFLMVDSIGRAQDDFISKIDEQYNITKKVGESDYERRAHLILENYRLTSYSFARLSTTEQKEILDLYQLIYSYNAGQVIQLEAGPQTLSVLRKTSENKLAKLFYRSVFSFAGLPMPNGTTLSHALDSNTLRKWRALESALLKLSDSSGSVQEAYNQYVAFVAHNLGLPNNTPEDVVKIRLVAMSRATTDADIKKVLAGYEQLTNDRKDIINKYLSNERPSLVYDTANLINFYKQHPSNKPGFENEYANAFNALAEIYQALERSSAFRESVAALSDGEVRVAIRPVIDHLFATGVTENLVGRLKIEINDNVYVVGPK